MPIGYLVAAELERLAELAPDPSSRRQALELAASAQRAGDARRYEPPMRRAA